MRPGMNVTIRDLLQRVRLVVGRRRVERELHDELAFHVECEPRKLVANGMELGEAAGAERICGTVIVGTSAAVLLAGVPPVR